MKHYSHLGGYGLGATQHEESEAKMKFDRAIEEHEMALKRAKAGDFRMDYSIADQVKDALNYRPVGGPLAGLSKQALEELDQKINGGET